MGLCLWCHVLLQAMTLGPGPISLYASGTQTFACTGSGCDGATWSISGPGSIDQSGNYQAPATVLAPATVTVTATAPDGSQVASATINLLVVPLPVEVFGGLS